MSERCRSVSRAVAELAAADAASARRVFAGLEEMAGRSRTWSGEVQLALAAFLRRHAPWPPPGRRSGRRQPAAQQIRELASFLFALRADRGSEDAACAAPAPQLDLSYTYLVATHAPGLDLSGFLLRGANLSDAVLDGAQLVGASLDDGAVLQRTVMNRADLTGANLAGANLAGAKLAGAVLAGVDLRRADMMGVDCSGADLTGAQLRGANLLWTDFRGAQLGGVDFTDAVFEGTRFGNRPAEA